MIEFDDAVQIILDAARPLATASVPLEEADGFVLARDVVAMIDSPRCDVSSMDGYAVRDSDLAAPPRRLRVCGESFAGHSGPSVLPPDGCSRIFTGGAVPAGADRVVIQEVVRRDRDWALFDQPVAGARYVRTTASDFAVGERLLSSGTLIDSRAMVTAASADVATLLVWRQPRFIVISTGDELAEPGMARTTTTSIPESVSFGVAAIGRKWGGEFVRRERVRDELTTLERAAADALESADLVVVIGGASVGERDFAKPMFGAGLELLFSKVAIKPGKPVWFGRAGGRLVLGLPGNPTSAMVTARLLLAPLMAGLGGRDPLSALRWRTAPLATDIATGGNRETFWRARWSADRVVLLHDQDSGAQRALAAADLLLRQPAFAPACGPGEAVDVLDF